MCSMGRASHPCQEGHDSDLGGGRTKEGTVLRTVHTDYHHTLFCLPARLLTSSFFVLFDSFSMNLSNLWTNLHIRSIMSTWTKINQ